MRILQGLRRHYHRFRTADREARIFLIRRRYIPKLSWALALPFLLLLAVLVRIGLWILKPWVHIRFGRILSQSIGTWTVPLEQYLCDKDAGMHPKNSWDVFYNYNKEGHLLKVPPKLREQIPNRQVDIMLSPKLRIVQWASAIDSLNRLLPFSAKDFVVPMPQVFDDRDLFQRFPSHLKFTEEEEQRGLSGLREIGMEPGSRFVCFHARKGSSYSNSIMPRMVSLYGDWAEQPYRDASLSNFLCAADHLTELGYYVVRMGKLEKEPLVHQNPRVIDYSTRFWSDFMDVFLSARCAFFIGTNSGMTSLPMIFRTPLALVNIAPFEEIVYSGTRDVYIPKKYYSAAEGRLLTFREILSERLLCHYPGKFDENAQAYYQSTGLEILENSPEEIIGLVLEVEQRLRGVFEPSDEDEELQGRYLAIVRSYGQELTPVQNLQRRRIGTHFLRAHPELLE